MDITYRNPDLINELIEALNLRGTIPTEELRDYAHQRAQRLGLNPTTGLRSVQDLTTLGAIRLTEGTHTKTELRGYSLTELGKAWHHADFTTIAVLTPWTDDNDNPHPRLKTWAPYTDPPQ